MASWISTRSRASSRIRSRTACAASSRAAPRASTTRSRSTRVRDAVNGGAQLVAGCNSGSTREVIRLGLQAKELGYDALLLSAPHTSLPTQRELGAHYAAVAAGVGLPIVLYNYPARAGIEIGFEALAQIRDLPAVVAIKEAS